MQLSMPGDQPDAIIGSIQFDYLAAIRDARNDPRQLEQLYQEARGRHSAARFAAALATCYQEAPQDLLYAAWYFRLEQTAESDLPARLSASWRVAIPLALLLGLIFWGLSAPQLLVLGQIPVLALLALPVTGLALIWFLALTARRGYVTAVVLSLALVAVTSYALAIPTFKGAITQRDYLTLMVAHLPLLAASAIGIWLLWRGASARNCFAFLTKSIESIGTAGVYVIAGGVFVGLTYGLFQALSIELDPLVIRLLVAGGVGLIPVVAVASVYDPTRTPSEQDFRRGFGKILTVLMQALLPLTLLVLLVYLAVIPFNFARPFTNRDVLIVYNVGLFAIMGLLVGVTPIAAREFPARFLPLLRIGIQLVAGLALLVGMYALAAIVYRTTQGQLTMNRVTVIGWNTINIGILAVLLVKQFTAKADGWIEAVHAVARGGAVAYVIWGLALTLALPWIF
ncbi:MAG TPA: hypothetical protein VGN32_06210 [Ktedonobacterales bacterium]|nr:hypothetical protein [Ktedonobacterales bacterium]